MQYPAVTLWKVSEQIAIMATSRSPAVGSSPTRSKPASSLKRMDTIVGVQVHAAEANRLKQDKQRKAGRVDWKRWGPYLSERQWATVREDYSHDGNWYAKCNADLV